MEKRERFGSRLGFILISAGCAIGLGNVWRFPYITGKYGGAAFVILYLLFLFILGLPVMVMEFAVGRASQKSCAKSFDTLEPKESKWHWYKWIGFTGNYLLMMFYTTVGGWMLAYVVKSATGVFDGLDAKGIGDVFTNMQGNTVEMLFWMLIVSVLGFLVCSMGLQKGVERITKVMMSCLFIIMIVLCVRSVTLPEAQKGLSFYLIPNFNEIFGKGFLHFGEVVYVAMGQAFFTLSVGISSMAIFGSYIGKDRSLTGEAVNIAILDTIVALMAGLIIFPACFNFGIEPGEGPGLVFATLPNVFNEMAGGRLWGSLFFLFMSFAALSTIIAVFESIISFCMDQWGWTRKKSVWVNAIGIIVLSLPCVFGFNIWDDVVIKGIGNIQSIEEFIVSNNMLPLGSLLYLLFCVTRYGWGWDNFIAEANEGKGLKFPHWTKGYLKYVLPILILIIFVMGYVQKFQVWLG